MTAVQDDISLNWRTWNNLKLRRWETLIAQTVEPQQEDGTFLVWSVAGTMGLLHDVVSNGLCQVYYSAGHGSADRDMNMIQPR